jgi:hypothetical protein
MSNALQQLNMIYVPEQDRLLLRISTNDASEFRIWLTRRYCSLLMQILVQQIEREGGYQELASRQQTLDQLRGGALTQPYAPGPNMHYPLGEQGVLGYRINVGKEKSGAVNLQLLPEAGTGMTFTLDKSTLYMLYNVLEQALEQTEWNLHMPRGRDPVH